MLAMLIASAAICSTLEPARTQPAVAEVTVDCQARGVKIDPRLYGIFFEEINLAGDGGLYAEKVRNRSFEDGPAPDHWTPGQGTVTTLVQHGESTTNRRSLRLEFTGAGTVDNGGYFGVAVRKGAAYKLRVKARSESGAVVVKANLIGADGKVLGETRLGKLSGDWDDLYGTIRSADTDGKSVLRLAFEGNGKNAVELDFVSLFPTKTWKGRANGFRPDLAEMLAGLKPAFVRFPGGCWVEGNTMAEALRWKTTIGPVEHRRTQGNLWGYQSTNGLGFHEYLQLSEDLGAEPLFVINCGMSHRDTVPMDQMDEMVQDALDAIEYANGPVDSKWGAMRAAAGHPEPFNLRLIEIGNENGGPRYAERYPLFVKAIQARFPEVEIIVNHWGGSYPETEYADHIDEHYYSNPQFFFDNAHKYDTYPRKGPKVYVGEYAVTQGCGQGNLIAAVSEAAFMTGMERNADVVSMASYAPLFAHVNHKRWNPDLICFDGLNVYGTPSYYVQKMFANNIGGWSLPVRVSQPSEKIEPIVGGVGVGTWITQAEFKDMKVVVDGKVVLDSPDGSAFRPARGDWKTEDGVLKQTGLSEATRTVAGRPTWQNMTFTLKARKTGGDEGFLITFGLKEEGEWLWWNIGGWGNTRHAIERGIGAGKSVLVDKRGSILSGRWYDLRVETSGATYKCYLDGQLMFEGELGPSKTVFSSASRDGKSGDLIVKLVNGAEAPVRCVVDLEGLAEGSLQGTVETLTSAKPGDENSLAEPRKVVPTKTPLRANGPKFERRLPAMSVTILRVRTAN